MKVMIPFYLELLTFFVLFRGMSPAKRLENNTASGTCEKLDCVMCIKMSLNRIIEFFAFNMILPDMSNEANQRILQQQKQITTSGGGSTT